jgi:hypothetical protein
MTIQSQLGHARPPCFLSDAFVKSVSVDEFITKPNWWLEGSNAVAKCSHDSYSVVPPWWEKPRPIGLHAIKVLPPAQYSFNDVFLKKRVCIAYTIR